jgi:hypothetical protein
MIKLFAHCQKAKCHELLPSLLHILIEFLLITMDLVKNEAKHPSTSSTHQQTEKGFFPSFVAT